MGKTIVTHSYKGGTGKTLFTMNLAALLALKGYRVVVLDMDLSAPSIHSFIPREMLDVFPKVNDSLLKDVSIQDTLMDLSEYINCSGKLWIGVSSNKTEDILRITRRTAKEFNQDASKLFNWISTLKSNPYNADFVVIDTSPGITFTSINSIATADIAYILFRVLEADIAGTKEMLDGLHTKLGCEIRLVPNQVPESYLHNEESRQGIREVLEQSFEIGVIQDLLLDTMILQELDISRNEIQSLLDKSDQRRKIFVTSNKYSAFNEALELLCNKLLES